MSKDKYIGPVTGKEYNLAAGERIDAEAEGIGYTGDKASPSAVVNGREVYKRIFIRRKRPEEIVADLDIRDEERLRLQIYALCKWFHDFAGQDVELIFGVRPL